jgi:hypothetical protein
MRDLSQKKLANSSHFPNREETTVKSVSPYPINEVTRPQARVIEEGAGVLPTQIPVVNPALQPTSPRKFAVRLSREYAPLLFRDGSYTIKGGLPKDAELVGIQYEARSDSYTFTFAQSHALEGVEATQIWPIITRPEEPLYTSLRREKIWTRLVKRIMSGLRQLRKTLST